MLRDMAPCTRLFVLLSALAISALVATGGIAWSSGGAVGKWQPRGPEGVDLTAVVVDPTNANTVYAGGRGFFKSTNGGRKWSELDTGVSFADDETVYELAIETKSPASVYAGTYDGRILVTADDGHSANVVKGPSIPFAPASRNWGSVFSIALDPLRRGTAYVGTETGALFKTTTGGRAWESADAGLAHHDISALAVDPARTATLYAGITYFGLYKSTDAGAHWRVLPSMTKRIYSIAVDTKSDTVYVGTEGSGVWASRDGGSTWRPFPAHTRQLRDAFISSLALDEDRANVVFAGTRRRGVWSTTPGMRWRRVTEPLPDLTEMALEQDRVYAATLLDGIFTTRVSP